VSRPCGPFMNPNRFAVYMAMVMALGVAIVFAPVRRPEGLAVQGKVARSRMEGIVVLAVLVLGFSQTLSRMTFAALGVAAMLSALGWAVAPRHHSEQGPRRRALLVLITPLALLLVVVALAGSAFGERVHSLAKLDSADLLSRWTAWLAGVELLKQAPWTGFGLGAFETVYGPHQPAQLSGRWDHVHNDWLELGIEAGLAGLAFTVMVVAAWWRAWVKGLSRKNIRKRFILAVGGAAVAVPLLCSGADYPLREPATAYLLAFVAGMLLRATVRENTVSSVATNVPQRVAIIVVAVPVLLVSAFVSARAGLAAFESPLRFSALPPHPAARDAEAYEKALGIAPAQPLCLQGFAQCQLLVLRGSRGASRDLAMAKMRKAVELLRRNLPSDYMTHWLEAGLLAEEGKLQEAIDALDRAAAQAPWNVNLGLNAFQARLNVTLPAYEKGSENWLHERDAVLVRARALLERVPQFEFYVVTELEKADLEQADILSLWDGLPGGTWGRARLAIRFGAWPEAERALEAAEVKSSEDEAWMLALRGRVRMEIQALDEGIADWDRLFALLERKPGALHEEWLKRELPNLSKDSLEALAGRSVNLRLMPPLALDAVSLLITSQRLATAERVLFPMLQDSSDPLAFRVGAEVSRSMGDRVTARERALKAWELAGRKPEWTVWLGQFEN